MKFIFWQNIVSPHQSYFLKELSLRFEVHLIVEKLMEEERRLQGWQLPDVGNVEVHLIADNNTLLLNSDNTHHFFSGIKSYKELHHKFLEISRSQKVNIIAESPIQLGYKAELRAILYKYYALKYGGRINLIFAMGELGVKWYQHAGFSEKKLRKFQYTIEEPSIDQISLSSPSKSIYKCVFIGQLIPRKGVDNLLKVFSNLNADNMELIIIGDGPMRNDIESYIKKNKMMEKVSLLGVLTHKEAMIYLSQNADYLVLPSRFDGWGAVVNEALSRGVKVITNDKCGASCIIEDETWGFVYPENRLNFLGAILKKISQKPKDKEESVKKVLAEKYHILHQKSVVDNFIKNFI